LLLVTAALGLPAPREVVRQLLGALADALDAPAGTLADARDSALGALSDALDSALGALSDALDSALGAPSDAGDAAFRSLADLANAFAGALANLAHSPAGSLTDGAKCLLGPFADVLHRVAGLVEEVPGAGTQLFDRPADALQERGVAIETQQNPFEDRRDIVELRLQ